MNTRHLQPADLRGRRWRGLVRESTEAQAERWSPDRQREDLRRAADELGLIPVFPEFYERVGSGEEAGAPEIAQALEDGGLEPDPDTAPVVREIFDAIASGQSFRPLAVALNARGLRTGRGEPWTSRSVGIILSNPVYTGRAVRYRRHHAAHYYTEAGEDGRADLGERFPAIVDPVLWEQVQEIVASHRPAQGARLARSYPLSGTLRCRSCGNRMNGMWSGRHRYYRCIGRIVYGVCDAPSIRADAAEAAFSEWLAASWQLPSDWRAEIARTTIAGVKAGERDRQASLAAALERVHKQYRWGDYEGKGGDEAYRRDVADIKTQMAVMAKPSIGSLEAVADALLDIGPAWAAAEPGVRASIPPLMLRSVEVEQGEIAEWVVRAELKPLLDLCTTRHEAVRSGRRVHAIRFSA